MPAQLPDPLVGLDDVEDVVLVDVAEPPEQALPEKSCVSIAEHRQRGRHTR